jgi:hypothetical protein
MYQQAKNNSGKDGQIIEKIERLSKKEEKLI